jgi:hypothetical protein
MATVRTASNTPTHLSEKHKSTTIADAVAVTLPQPELKAAAPLTQSLPTAAVARTSELSLPEPQSVGSLDSGYASKTSTPDGSLVKNQHGFADEFLAPFGGRFSRKTVKLRTFDRPIPESIQNRFYDLKELFDRPLYNYLAEKKVKFTAISIKLKVWGKTKSLQSHGWLFSATRLRQNE